MWSTRAMSTLRSAFGVWCRHHRVNLRLTQAQLADRVGVTRGYIAGIEMGRANATLEVVSKVAGALDVDIAWRLLPPVIHDASSVRDLVHAGCSAYVDRRLRRSGSQTAREVEIVHSRSHGWIDLLAYRSEGAVLTIVEIKTRIDDLGALERQIAWYERSALEAARSMGWRPTRVATWLLILATTETETVLHSNRALFDAAFPGRAPQALRWLDGGGPIPPRRVVALIDPLSRRRDWLIRTCLDGRRSDLPYRSVREAAERMRA